MQMKSRSIWFVSILAGLLFSHALIAETSLRAQNLQKVTPAYLSDVVVEDKGEGVRITGTAASMQDVSRYMRFLDDSLGAPSLVSMQRKGDRSEFILEIRKFSK